MVPERRSGLRPSENELLEWRSGAFCHKNTRDSEPDEFSSHSQNLCSLWIHEHSHTQKSVYSEMCLKHNMYQNGNLHPVAYFSSPKAEDSFIRFYIL
jgi:hypothetical protein